MAAIVLPDRALSDVVHVLYQDVDNARDVAMNLALQRYVRGAVHWPLRWNVSESSAALFRAMGEICLDQANSHV